MLFWTVREDHIKLNKEYELLLKYFCFWDSFEIYFRSYECYDSLEIWIVNNCCNLSELFSADDEKLQIWNIRIWKWYSVCCMNYPVIFYIIPWLPGHMGDNHMVDIFIRIKAWVNLVNLLDLIVISRYFQHRNLIIIIRWF